MIKRIFNWTAGSFFRTLGRFLFYIVIGLIAMLFISGKVHAISFDPYTWGGKQVNGLDYSTISKNGTLTFDLNLTYTGEINDEITSKYGLLNAWNGSSGSNGTTYNFLISTCDLGGTLTGFANKYNSLVKRVNSGLTCSIAGYTGSVTYYFVKLTPNVYNVGNSTTYYVNWNSTLTFTNSYNYAIIFSISSIDILTDEEMTSLINDYSNLNALNSQISKIQETNSKLDEQISQNETIIDQNQDIIDNQDETNDLLGSESDDTTDKSCGVICKLKGIFTGIIELPGKIISGLIDALKSLFVPTEEQLQEIIDKSSGLAENFGFVGETIDFFIDIFTSMLGMVNGNGCITLPKFEIGATSLFDSHVFWEEQRTCLSDNVVLNTHIDTIRTITSITLVCLFLGFASKQFFKILSKSESESESQ